MIQLKGPQIALTPAPVTSDNGAPANGTPATETLSVTGLNASDGETVVIHNRTYTWRTAPATAPAVNGEVAVGATTALSLANLVALINSEDDNPSYPRDPNVVASISVVGAQATEVLTFTGNALNTETVVIDGKSYTFQTVLTDVDGNVLIGATASDSLDNLIAAVVLGAGAGTLYATSTTLHSTVTAAAGAGDTVDVTAKLAGTQANSIALSTTVTGASWGAGTMSGGTDDAMLATARQVGIAPNSWDTAETMANGSWGAATMSGGVARDGIRLDDNIDPQAKPSMYDLLVTITGTGAISADVFLHGYVDDGLDGNDGEYARLGTGPNAGHVNEGTAIAGTTKKTWRRPLENLGYMGDLYLEVLNATGTAFSLTAKLAPVYEGDRHWG